MVLSDISIRRPVLATVMSLLIVLLGAICFQRLSVREYPNIDPPTVSVRTVYKGATAQVMESVVTTPIEDALSGIEGIKTIKSQSREEVSQITVTFVTGRDVDAAAADVRDRVSRIAYLLPEAVLAPVISKIEADALPDHVDRAGERPPLAHGTHRLCRSLSDRPAQGSAAEWRPPSSAGSADMPCESGSTANAWRRRV